MKRIVSRFICLLMTALLIIPGAVPSFAEDTVAGGVLRASTLDEYIDATGPAEDDACGTDELFSTCRIKIKRPLDSLEGAETGVCYQGDTLLSFGSAAETRKAYERLCEEYGAENVIVDLPLLAADTAAKPVGWGTDFMNIGEESKRQAKKYGANAGKVTIAVIDSGIDETHEIFAGRTISPSSRDFLDTSEGIADQDGHGTSVAGIISESAPDNVDLMILKTYTDGTNISLETVGQAIRYAADNGADVINLSMSTSFSASMAKYPEMVRYSIADMDDQLKYAAEKGIIICASSGNNGADMDELNSFPAISEHTLAVGAIDMESKRWSYSNYGSKLDFCAPGDMLIVAVNNSGSKYYALDIEHCSGTSFAAPYIAVCCAFVKTDDKDADNQKAIQILKSKCVDYGDEGWDCYYGWGMPKYEVFTESGGTAAEPEAEAEPETKPATKTKSVKTVTLNVRTVTAKAVSKAVKKAGGTSKSVTKIILGKKVRKIGPKAFAKYKKVTVLEVRTKKLTKKKVKNALKGSKIRTVRVKVAKKVKTNKSYVKKYKKIFTKKNAGRKVSVKR